MRLYERNIRRIRRIPGAYPWMWRISGGKRRILSISMRRLAAMRRTLHTVCRGLVQDRAPSSGQSTPGQRREPLAAAQHAPPGLEDRSHPSWRCGPPVEGRLSPSKEPTHEGEGAPPAERRRPHGRESTAIDPRYVRFATACTSPSPRSAGHASKGPCRPCRCRCPHPRSASRRRARSASRRTSRRARRPCRSRLRTGG
jgi:hypothetical protein